MATETLVAKKDRREGKGRVIALSRRVYRIVNTDVFYVESETNDEMYYYVMFNTDKEFEWCSCPDSSSRRMKCKHIFGVEYAIRWGTVTDTDKLPATVKKDNNSAVAKQKSSSKSWRDDDYGF